MKRNATKKGGVKADVEVRDNSNDSDNGQGRVVRIELYLMLQQLKGARELAASYSKEHKPDVWLHMILDKATMKINEVMNDVACVIGWDVLESVEREECTALKG